MLCIKKVVLALATGGLLSSGAAQAELEDRGGGMLYDTALNVTWLQDANYAKTSGYDADGLMNWSAAKTWADNLSYGGYSDWRLASISAVGEGWQEIFAYDGTTDIGYNITNPRSELSYMYYVTLGLKGRYSSAGIYQPDFGVFGTGTSGGQNDVGLVKNLQSYAYWSNTAYAINPIGVAWSFQTMSGFQVDYGQDGEIAAWAVRAGDVAAVPEPETYTMFLAGMGLLAGMAKRRRRFDAS